MKTSLLLTCSMFATVLGTATVLVAPSVALAQPAGMGGSGMGGPGMGGPGMGGMGGPGMGAPSGEEDKKEGIAEPAPKAAGSLPTVEVLPPPKAKRTRWKLLQVDGYYRLRTDWFKNFNLGFVDDADQGGAAFPQPLSCNTDPLTASCGDTMSGANSRLRLEPQFNLDEGTAVFMQIDVLDNLVLGSTPMGDALDGSTPGNIAVANETQTQPVRGYNSDRNALAVKRAWAEVSLPLGILKFGRQPQHWGMGMMLNSGGHDPIHGTHDDDADYGDNVDRVSFSTQIPGSDLRAMIASDWLVTRLASNQTSNAGLGREDHPFDLDDSDDANQWVLTISKLDAPQEWANRIARNRFAYNWGVYFAYRTQSKDVDLTDFTLGGQLNTNTLVTRDATMYIPNAWGRVAYRNHLLEGEVASRFGSLTALDSQLNARSIDIKSFGGVARYTFAALENKLHTGIEGAYASGENADNTIPGRTHIAYRQPLGGASDNELTGFTFNRDFKPDMIMFRHLIGAVSNAVYAKPFISYQLTNSISGRAANITAFAPRASATPGNDTYWGTEFNGEVAYRNQGFSAAVMGAVYIPLGAMAHPDTAAAEGGFGNNIGDATTAYAITSRLMLSF